MQNLEYTVLNDNGIKTYVLHGVPGVIANILNPDSIVFGIKSKDTYILPCFVSEDTNFAGCNLTRHWGWVSRGIGEAYSKHHIPFNYSGWYYTKWNYENRQRPLVELILKEFAIIKEVYDQNVLVGVV